MKQEKTIARLRGEVAKFRANSTQKMETSNPFALCKAAIVPFKKENVANFIDSVKMAIAQLKNDEVAIRLALQYAKQRVIGCDKITLGEFDSVEEFERVLLLEFKPAKDEATLTTELCRVAQKREENVEVFSKRVEKLKEQLSYAIRCNVAKNQQSAEYLKQRVIDTEKLAITKFLDGLKAGVLERTRKVDSSLPLAIEAALAAEANFATVENVRRGEPTHHGGNHRSNNNNNKKPNQKPGQQTTSGASTSASESTRFNGVCSFCKKYGHKKADCRALKAKEAQGAQTNNEPKNEAGGAAPVKAATLVVMKK